MIPQRPAIHNLLSARLFLLVLLGPLLAWPGGCGSDDNDVAPACGDLVEEWSGGPLPGYVPLSVAEVQTVLGQAVEQAFAIGSAAVVAAVDREGVVLGVFGMTGAATGPAFPVPASLPPDGAPGINAAIAKARTAAALSSNQNAFTTVTAAYIVDAHFPPGIRNTPGGPLFGVQNSNDTGSDVVRGVGPGGAPISNNPSPLPDPNGYSGLAGGMPLYKDGILVGAVGVSSASAGDDEISAIAGARGFLAPESIRACAILVEGIRLAFADATPPFVRALLPFGSLPGSVLVPIVAGAAPPAIPIVTLGGVSGQLVFPIVAGGALTTTDVTTMLSNAAARMTVTRAAIRLPLGSRAQVTVAVVDTAGNILGAFRPADCTRFSLDLAVQKARSAVAFSDGTATAALGEPVAGLPLGTAVTTRALGFLAQPFYPPGIDGNPPGPLFGIQDALPGGLGAGIPGLDVTPATIGDATDGDGLAIFPGGIPLYIGGVLVGGIGVSGDGVDQDDYIAAGGATGYEPPEALRCDNVFVGGLRLPYVKFPRNPSAGIR